LAAANPIGGRYDRSRTLRFNVNISPPIMSRFDLFFVIFDEKRDDEDFHIAHHIVNMHRLKEDSLHPDFSTEELQTYIKFCRTIKPKFTKEAANMLKEEYKRMRQNEKNAQKSSYKITVRALESLIRLSEAMARAHCDYEIKPNYVREVCRLMRQSNINIVRGDVEFSDDIQEALNKDMAMARQLQPASDMMMDQQQPMENVEQNKKVKMTFDEYTKYAIMIIQIMKEFESQGEDNVRQQDIVEKMITQIEIVTTERGTSVEKSMETVKKVSNVIQHLITNENILMVSQDAKAKNDRYITLNTNVEMSTVQNMLQGNKEPVY
jgi:DNA replication licensing factor MCM6